MFKFNVSSANGVPMKQIQEWLGHSDFWAAANIYAHLDSRRNAQWLGLCTELKKKSQQPEKPTTGVISVKRVRKRWICVFDRWIRTLEAIIARKRDVRPAL